MSIIVFGSCASTIECLRVNSVKRFKSITEVSMEGSSSEYFLWMTCWTIRIQRRSIGVILCSMGCKSPRLDWLGIMGNPKLILLSVSGITKLTYCRHFNTGARYHIPSTIHLQPRWWDRILLQQGFESLQILAALRDDLRRESFRRFERRHA